MRKGKLCCQRSPAPTSASVARCSASLPRNYIHAALRQSPFKAAAMGWEWGGKGTREGLVTRCYVCDAREAALENKAQVLFRGNRLLLNALVTMRTE